jgi:hypothetical protein
MRPSGSTRALIAILVVAAGLSAAGAHAAAATPPTAVTGAATALGATSATVEGSVDPNGLATTWYVEYGPTTAYGSRTANESAGSGTTPVDVSARVTGLAVGTSYHYRVVATSSAGTARGADAVLTTLAPPAPVTGAAVDVGTSSAALTGTVDPKGQPTTWFFEYGPTTSYGSRTDTRSAGSGTSALAVSATVGGL